MCESLPDESKREERDSLVVDIHFCLGAIAAETNDLERSDYYKKSALDKQTAVSQRLDTLDVRLTRSQSEYAIALIVKEEYDAAIELFRLSIKTDKTLGAYPYNWTAEINLGLAYILKGDFRMADEVLVAAQARREEMYGSMDTMSSGFVTSPHFT